MKLIKYDPHSLINYACLGICNDSFFKLIINTKDKNLNYNRCILNDDEVNFIEKYRSDIIKKFEISEQDLEINDNVAIILILAESEEEKRAKYFIFGESFCKDQMIFSLAPLKDLIKFKIISEV